MSYRFEKEENGQQALVIEGFSDGTGKGPYDGAHRMLSVNLDNEGEVSVGYPITTSTTSGATLGVPIARSTRLFAYGGPGVPSGSPQSFAMLDSAGHVFESTSITGTWTYLSSNSTLTDASNADGIAYWLGYLFKTRQGNIDYWNGSTWANAWQTTLRPAKHFMYVGTDNVLYITNDNYIATIELTNPSDPTSFVPGTSSTYTFTIHKLQLPATDQALSLAEIGGGNSPRSTLLIGGIGNLVYPWDKTSANFALPIVVGDSYIKNIIAVNQSAFIFPGNQQGRGRIYITNGSQAEEWFKMPDYITNIQDPYFIWGDAVVNRNKLIFGAYVSSNAGAVQVFSQLWAVDLNTKKFCSVSEIPSAATGKGNATALLATGNLSTPGLGVLVGWDDSGSAPGIGYLGTTAGIGSSTITTDLLPVGTFTQKKTYSQVEYKLRSPLQSGETLTITPIVNGVSVTSLTFSPTIGTGQLSGYAPVTWQGAQWLQFDISLTGNSATSGVRLKELRLR